MSSAGALFCEAPGQTLDLGEAAKAIRASLTGAAAAPGQDLTAAVLTSAAADAPRTDGTMDTFAPDFLFTGTLTEASRFAARADLSLRQWELIEELDAPLRVYRAMGVEQMRELAPRGDDDDRVARRTFSWEFDGTTDGVAGAYSYNAWPVVEFRSGRHRA